MLYCDGGMLLLAKSRIPDDRLLGLNAVSKCTLSEIQQTPYFYMLQLLAGRRRQIGDAIQDVASHDTRRSLSRM